MRLQEFLTEAPVAPAQPEGSPVVDQGIENLKAALSLKIKQMPPDAATAKALQEVEELLTHTRCITADNKVTFGYRSNNFTRYTT